MSSTYDAALEVKEAISNVDVSLMQIARALDRLVVLNESNVSDKVLKNPLACPHCSYRLVGQEVHHKFRCNRCGVLWHISVLAGSLLEEGSRFKNGKESDHDE